MVKNIKLLIIVLFVVFSLPLLADAEYDIIPLEPSNPDFISSKVISCVYDLSESGYAVGYYQDPPEQLFLSKGFIYHPDQGFISILGPFENITLAAKLVNNNGVIAGTFDPEEWQIDGPSKLHIFKSEVFIFDPKQDFFLNITSLDETKDYHYANSVVDMTDNGKVLVSGWKISEQVEKGYVYDLSTGEVMTEVPHYPEAINERGDILGRTSFYRAGQGFMDFHSLHPSGQWRFIGSLLNEEGVIAGYCRDDNYIEKGFIWDEENGLREIPTLGGDEIYAAGLNTMSQVVGMSEVKNLIFHAFLYDESFGVLDLGTLGGKHSEANDINDLTQVVGYSDSKSKGKRAFIWDQAHGMRDLNDLIPKNSSWKKLKEAIKINNQGYIIGEGIYCGQERGFLLIPKS